MGSAASGPARTATFAPRSLRDWAHASGSGGSINPPNGDGVCGAILAAGMSSPDDVFQYVRPPTATSSIFRTVTAPASVRDALPRRASLTPANAFAPRAVTRPYSPGTTSPSPSSGISTPAAGFRVGSRYLSQIHPRGSISIHRSHPGPAAARFQPTRVVSAIVPSDLASLSGR